MIWMALSIVFLACAVGSGLTNIARALHDITIKHNIGTIKVQMRKQINPQSHHFDADIKTRLL